MKINISHIIVGLFIFLLSCTDDGGDLCLSNQMALKASFYARITDEDTTETAIAIDGLSVTGIYPNNIDSNIVTDTVNVSSVFLPLSPQAEGTEFLFEINGRKESMKFFTSKELAFISEECGYIFHFNIDSVKFTSNIFIDNVVVEDPAVVYNQSTDHVKIYFF